jgi:hypothetical protein
MRDLHAAPADVIDRPAGADTALLGAFLADRDVACPLCGYNLRTLSGTRCTECGNELRLQVGLVEPRLGAYLAAVAGASAGLGGGGLFTLVALAEAPRQWWDGPSGRLLMAQVAFAAVLLPVLLARRRAFRRAAPARQRTWAVLIWGLFAALWVLFVAYFDG